MSQERRKFDKEFKLMTVELSKSRENLNELAQELGIRVELIYRWRTEFLDKGEGSFPGHGKPKHTPEEAEIAQLKKQFRERSGDGKGYGPDADARLRVKKGHQHLLPGRREIYQFINDNNSRFPAREDV